MSAFEKHLQFCGACKGSEAAPEPELRKGNQRTYHGGPEVKVQQQGVGGAGNSYPETGADHAAFLRRWCVDVRDEYRRAVLRRSFFRYWEAE